MMASDPAVVSWILVGFSWVVVVLATAGAAVRSWRMSRGVARWIGVVLGLVTGYVAGNLASSALLFADIGNWSNPKVFSVAAFGSSGGAVLVIMALGLHSAWLRTDKFARLALEDAAAETHSSHSSSLSALVIWASIDLSVCIGVLWSVFAENEQNAARDLALRNVLVALAIGTWFCQLLRDSVPFNGSIPDSRLLTMVVLWLRWVTVAGVVWLAYRAAQWSAVVVDSPATSGTMEES